MIPVDKVREIISRHKLLEKENVIVHTYKGSEISLKGAGGPTCLTKPLLRSLPSD